MIFTKIVIKNFYKNSEISHLGFSPSVRWWKVAFKIPTVWGLKFNWILTWNSGNQIIFATRFFFKYLLILWVNFERLGQRNNSTVEFFVSRDNRTYISKGSEAEFNFLLQIKSRSFFVVTRNNKWAADDQLPPENQNPTKKPFPHPYAKRYTLNTLWLIRKTSS